MFTFTKKYNKKSIASVITEEEDSKIQNTQRGSCDPCLPCELCFGASCLGSLYGCWNCLQDCCGPSDCCEDNC